MSDKENLLPHKSDSDLVALARAGDKAAFGRLIERYQTMVYHVALKTVRNEYLAQELAQEALLQAYLSLDRLRDAARFKNWPYGAALNVCKSYLRQQKMDFFTASRRHGTKSRRQAQRCHKPGFVYGQSYLCG
jgi:RNA polymerase sigma-70 factor (ECF subfamily)